MTHWSRQCRCSAGVDVAPGLGTWCRRPATQEDGLCDSCRARCRAHPVLTMEQAQQRATFQAAIQSMAD